MEEIIECHDGAGVSALNADTHDEHQHQCYRECHAHREIVR